MTGDAAQKKITESKYINKMPYPSSVPQRHRDKNMTAKAGGGHTMPLFCNSETALTYDPQFASRWDLSLIFA